MYSCIPTVDWYGRVSCCVYLSDRVADLNTMATHYGSPPLMEAGGLTAFRVIEDAPSLRSQTP